MDPLKLVIIFFIISAMPPPCFAMYKKFEVQNVTCSNYEIYIQIDVGKNFEGKIYAASQYFNPFCRYDAVPAQNPIVFAIPANNCDTLVSVVDGYIYFSNTIVIQRHRFIETPWDVLENISCKIDMPKMSGKLEDQDRVFKSPGLESWMEFKIGSHAFDSHQVNKLTVGDNFLLTVHLKTSEHKVNMRVLNCWAHDGTTLQNSIYVLHVYNNHKCRSSSIFSDFTIIRNVDESELVAYAYLKAFKLPSTLNLHITCRIALCKIECVNHCEPFQSIREKNHIKNMLRSFHTRSVSDEMPASNDDKRIRLLKATINALGEKLVQTRIQRLQEDDADFNKRSSRVTPEQEDSDTGEIRGDIIDEYYTSAPSDVDFITKGSVKSRDMSMKYNNTRFWDDEYYYNLTSSIVILSAHESGYQSDVTPLTTSACVSKSRFVWGISILSSLLIVVIFTCIGLAFYLRKEKKKHLIDNFLLYNYY